MLVVKQFIKLVKKFSVIFFAEHKKRSQHFSFPTVSFNRPTSWQEGGGYKKEASTLGVFVESHSIENGHVFDVTFLEKDPTKREAQ